MRFVSIEQALAQARAALYRFPMALLSGAVAAGTALVLIDRTGDQLELVRLLLAATLGFPLFVALQTTAERRAWSARFRRIAAATGTVWLVLFYIVSDGWSEVLLATRYIQINVALHLLVAVLPFAGFAAGKSFWQYNRTLFLRFLLAALYTGVLFVGLAIALLALDNLFGIDIDGEAYGRLWIVLAFVFDPWFFLGGVPDDIGELETRADYPTGLKVFAQFILIPVVTVYLLILTAYLVRILITRTWPSGWIGYLVSSVAAAGTLALLLVHPIRERTDSRWVDAYGRWFYVLMLPSIAMLLMAIGQRLGQYGFTERRYFLLILALWLGAIALYYGITASRNIRIIPVTLAALALLTLAGPWSAYSVSRGSQASRLAGLLLRNGALENGTVREPAGEVSFDDRREISAVLYYLIETHGVSSLGSVSDDLRVAAEQAASTADRASVRESAAQGAMDLLGLAYVSRWRSAREAYVNFFTNQAGVPIELAGYDVLVRMSLTRPQPVPIGTDTLHFAFTPDPATLIISRRDQTLVTLPLWQLVDQVRQSRTEPVAMGPRGAATQPLEVMAEGGTIRVRVLINSLVARGEGEAAEITDAEADVLLAILGPET